MASGWGELGEKEGGMVQQHELKGPENCRMVESTGSEGREAFFLTRDPPLPSWFTLGFLQGLAKPWFPGEQ